MVMAFRPIQTAAGKLPALATRGRNIEPTLMEPLFSPRSHRKSLSLRFDHLDFFQCCGDTHAKRAGQVVIASARETKGPRFLRLFQNRLPGRRTSGRGERFQRHTNLR